MASKLQHLDSYPFSTERLWAIFTTEQYWHDLVERMNAGHGHVEKVTIAGDTVTVEMNQGIPAEKLPSAVTKIMPGDSGFRGGTHIGWSETESWPRCTQRSRARRCR